MVILQQHVSEADRLRLEREHFRPACSVRDVLQVVPWAWRGCPRTCDARPWPPVGHRSHCCTG